MGDKKLPCRLCSSLEFREKAIRLFGSKGEEWRGKLSEILNISIGSRRDGLPQQICLKCARCVNAAYDLKRKAHDNILHQLQQSHKRANSTATNSVDLSPETVQLLPSEKRPTTVRRRLDLGESNLQCKFQCYM